jgi:hypothetical protein
MKPAFLVVLLTILTPALAPAQDTNTAKLFLLHVYASYADPDTRHETQREDKFYSPGLYSLIAADRRGHPGDVGKLDGDPICDCQDPGNPGELKVQSITFSALTPLKLKAIVAFTILKEPRTVIFMLIQTPTGWRIDDISTPDTPSLRTLLRRN